ncbi:hypothetical protein C8E03_108198 [Lachnotalea glycerini]|uniref:Uncharacterized protein n=1 Tax=Lachnotalea glycerini TaxID=1763509 RepID=A0A318EK62_9FIRM|nr:hypothetical protein [Lachnotalea glycerini]PXV88471.1 hypothetical protein C8E03_108198 [Lachnotalea glycerini]
MAWIEPKLDWNESYDIEGTYTGDYFNIEDYNRIKNNIDELKTMTIELYPEFSLSTMGEDKNYEDYPYADEINMITSNLDTIMAKTYTNQFSIGTRILYYDNTPFIGFADLNRIESACLRIYNTITAQHNSRRRLAFYLGRKERF